MLFGFDSSMRLRIGSTDDSKYKWTKWNCSHRMFVCAANSIHTTVYYFSKYISVRNSGTIAYPIAVRVKHSQISCINVWMCMCVGLCVRHAVVFFDILARRNFLNELPVEKWKITNSNKPNSFREKKKHYVCVCLCAGLCVVTDILSHSLDNLWIVNCVILLIVVTVAAAAATAVDFQNKSKSSAEKN